MDDLDDAEIDKERGVDVRCINCLFCKSDVNLPPDDVTDSKFDVLRKHFDSHKIQLKEFIRKTVRPLLFDNLSIQSINFL